MTAATNAPVATGGHDTTTWEVRVWLPVVPAASLTTNRRSRGGWREHAGDTAKVLADCGWWLREHHAGTAVHGPVALAFEVVWPPGRRRVDADALASLCKGHLDALVRHNVLPDGDGPDAVLTVSYAQRKTKVAADAGVLVTITRGVPI